MSLIKGIHHAALWCRDEEEMETARKFYGEVLGLDVAREWGSSVMFETGAGCIEITRNGSEMAKTGSIRHFALDVEDTDALVKAVKDAGYEVFNGPKDVVLASNPPLPARIAFCYGPLGEEIEFFQVK